MGSAESVDLSSLSRQELIDLADTELNHDHLDSAIACLRTLLVRDPEDVEVIFRLAGSSECGLLEEAVDLLDSIPEDHPEAGLAALAEQIGVLSCSGVLGGNELSESIICSARCFRTPSARKVVESIGTTRKQLIMSVSCVVSVM